MRIHQRIKNIYLIDHLIFNKKIKININTLYRLVNNHILLALENVNISISSSQLNKNDYLLIDKFNFLSYHRIIEKKESIQSSYKLNNKPNNNLIKLIPYKYIGYSNLGINKNIIF
jgi:hypothetical protein